MKGHTYLELDLGILGTFFDAKVSYEGHQVYGGRFAYAINSVKIKHKDTEIELIGLIENDKRSEQKIRDLLFEQLEEQGII